MNLTIDHLSYHIHDLRFHYHAEVTSSITGVFGLSGAGKTTLLNLLCGIIKPDSGKLVYNDQVFFNSQRSFNLPAGNRQIGVVFQDNYLFPHMTVRKNLNYSKPYVNNKKEFISLDAVLDLLDIRQLLDKKPFQLSGGERQRVAIGRALLSQPNLLLMDEPFSNLDKQRREQIISYLLKINDRFHLPLLIISHDLEDMLKLTDSLLIIKNGEIHASGRYLDIVNSGLADELLPISGYYNIFDLHHTRYLEMEKLHLFSSDGEQTSMQLRTSSEKLSKSTPGQSRIRFALRPVDITINTKPDNYTSARNQLEGTVKKIQCHDDVCFLTVDCGVPLVSQITRTAVDSMALKEGQSVYCLIKSNALDIIHVYN